MMSERSRPVSEIRRPGGVIAVLPYLLDFIVPLVAFYVLTAAGVSSFWSLTIGGALTGVTSVVNTVRRRRLDGLGLLVIAEIALSLVLIATTRDPRLVLARSSLYLALAGIWVLASAVIRRPVTISTSKGFAAKDNGADGILAVDWLTANSEPFMLIHRRRGGAGGHHLPHHRCAGRVGHRDPRHHRDRHLPDRLEAGRQAAGGASQGAVAGAGRARHVLRVRQARSMRLAGPPNRSDLRYRG
jgi:hypothetical protein